MQINEWAGNDGRLNGLNGTVIYGQLLTVADDGRGAEGHLAV